PHSICLPHTRLFFSYRSAAHRALHSFPTRRSSDLGKVALEELVLNAVTIVPRLLRKNSSGDMPPRNFTKSGNTTNRCSASPPRIDRKSTRLNSSHVAISYAVFCLKKKKRKGTRI